MKYTQEQIDFAKKMLQETLTDQSFEAPIIHLAIHKRTVDLNGNSKWHLKVFVVRGQVSEPSGVGAIANMTRSVGILGDFRFVDGNNLIAVGDTGNVAEVVAKALGVDRVVFEVI